MPQQFLSRNDVNNYGNDLVDFSMRAAAQAVAPQLEALGQQNAQLEHQIAIERRKRLDEEVERAVPNYREIDASPAWHQWLLGIHDLSGRVRQEWLNDAIAAGSATRVVAFFNGFLAQHANDGGRAPSPRRGGAASSEPVMTDTGKLFTRSQIAALYELHRKGKLVGPEWDRTEQDIIRAGREGRVIGAQDPHGR